jgi:preprotein translocase subunit SecA
MPLQPLRLLAAGILCPKPLPPCARRAKRTTGLRHYDVQLWAAWSCTRGAIAEMKTGEGKTLVATLPLYLNALAGRGAHLVTPNDYLSKVGLQLMGPIYQLLGLSAAVIQNSAGNPDAGSFIFDPEYPNSDDRFQYLRPIRAARPTAPISPTAPTTSSASTICATTWCRMSPG